MYQCKACMREFDSVDGISEHVTVAHKKVWGKNWRTLASGSANGNRPKSYPPISRDPMRHLDTALAEIDTRLAEIQKEMAIRYELESEALMLRGQRDQIMFAKKMSAPVPQIVPAEEKKEYVANG